MISCCACSALQVLEAEAAELGPSVLVRCAAPLSFCSPLRVLQLPPPGAAAASHGPAAHNVLCLPLFPTFPQPKELREELLNLLTSPELMVEFTLRLLGLEGCADTVVGDGMIRWAGLAE